MAKFFDRVIEACTWIFRGVDRARRLALNLLFLAIVVVLIGWMLADRRPKVPDPTALVLAPYGTLVEELSGSPDDQVILALLGERRPETLVRTLVEAVEIATDDARVKVLVLETDRLARAGLSKLQDLSDAIARFREGGKTVIASGSYFTQAQYYLASTADEIYMHPMGLVFLPGYGSYRNYYGDALEKLAVDWHVFRVGEYKSAVEPFLRRDMSPEARQSRERWLTVLWQAYSRDVERARRLEPGSLERYASDFAALLAAHEGDGAELARSFGLVDQLAYPDEVRERLIELVGKDEDGTSYRQIDHGSYRRAQRRPEEKSDNQIAVVVANGGIYDGRRSPGSIGGDSTAELIRRAREDEGVKGLVLRIDSPGGSAFASEVIRREIELAQRDGKPVVASMGSVAASGGYWIAMSADEIIAMPTTITGSIGIFAMFPTFPRTLEKIGVYNDGVGTGPLAGTLRPERRLPDEAGQAMEVLIQQGYRDFIERVAAGRRKTVEEVDAVARGRVWAGVDALQIGLIDRLGSLEDSIEAAAGLAGLEDDYRVVYVVQESGWRARLLDRLAAVLAGRLDSLSHLSTLPGWVEESARFGDLGDPQGLYAYCYCEPN